MVPNGWEVKPLSSITKWSSGGTPSKNNPDYWNGEIPWISAASMRGHYFEKSELKISDLAVSNGAKMAPKNSLLLLVRGSMLWNKIPVGIAARKVAFNQDVKCLVPHADELTTEFLLYWFLTYEHRLMNMVTGTGIGAGKLDTTDLQGLDVFLPPLPEQRKIAQILSTWDRGIAITEKLIDASKQQKKALIQQLLTGKKRLIDPETGKAFEGDWRKSKTPYASLPSDWSELALEKLSLFITKGATPTTYGFEWQEYGIPFLRSECVGKNGFKESGLNYICDAAHEAMARSKVYAGDILITITGNVGRVCRLPNKYPQANINQHIAKVTLKDENVCSDFIFHCLQDNKYQSNFERITTGQAYPQISLVQVRNTIVPLPPISEQQKIASVLTAADKEIELLEAKLLHFKQEKKALMQQLLTGKRRVSLSS